MSLLCPSTLKTSFRDATPLNARESLKALLQKDTSTSPKNNPPSPTMEWEHCLDLLVDDFLTRRSELLRLNKARKTQIENSIRRFSDTTSSLEEILQSRVGSQENEGLNLFAYEIAVFQLLQILLLKRWSDLSLLDESDNDSAKHTVNWRITSFLKKRGRRIIQKHDWSFLKQNCYSWFSPAHTTSQSIWSVLSKLDLGKAGSHFLLETLHQISARSRLSIIGFAPKLIGPKESWELFLEYLRTQRNMDSGVSITGDISNPLLISGLVNGDSLNSLQNLLTEKSLEGVWAFTNSEFQRFLTEINLLWISPSDIPQLNLYSKLMLSELGGQTQKSQLFSESFRVPFPAQLAACFPEGNGEELQDAVHFLDQLKERGQLLLTSDSFWPTDSSDRAQKLRENTLQKSLLKVIVDLRHAAGTKGESLPKGLFLLEKNSSKEERDANRPFILKIKGTISAEKLPQIWRKVLEALEQNQHPGEVLDTVLQTDSARLEAMAAATSQQFLRNGPWQTLTESSFYEVSAQLKRYPNRAFASGTLLRAKNTKDINFQRAIYIKDIPGQALKADCKDGQFLFLPDNRVPEPSAFFLAQINSAPLQFWYRLELEQEAKRLSRGQQRQNEQLLKMMPLARLFADGTLIPAIQSPQHFAGHSDLRRRLPALLRPQESRTLYQSAELLQVIVNLQHSIDQNLEVTREFSHHLYPNLSLHRWNLPAQLPEADPAQSLKILQHLDHTALLHHPSIHVTRLKPSHDFRINAVVLKPQLSGPMSELELQSGLDTMMRLSGPAILIRAAHSALLGQLGRHWQESAMKILLPTDIFLVNAQLAEISRTIQEQLKSTKECIEIMDRIFCCLFSLSNAFEDDKAYQTIRRHLTHEETKIQVDFQRPVEIKREDFVVPKGILQ